MSCCNRTRKNRPHSKFCAYCGKRIPSRGLAFALALGRMIKATRHRFRAEIEHRSPLEILGDEIEHQKSEMIEWRRGIMRYEQYVAENHRSAGKAEADLMAQKLNRMKERFDIALDGTRQLIGDHKRLTLEFDLARIAMNAENCSPFRSC